MKQDNFYFSITLPKGGSCTIVTHWEMTEEEFVSIFKVLAHFAGFSFVQSDRMSEEVLDNTEE